ncbi:MAG: pyridoxal phosphate-dependent aminotransferase [Muribaculaceae bacterium]|nr:pyridoxal phosphate-dependent aminotransferase [Muribaculaceae bacterium]
MINISELVESLAPSGTLAMAQKAGEMKAAGIDVISLSLGEPDFPTPSHIKEAAKRAIDENYTTYTPVAGYPSLRKAISDTLRAQGLDYAPEQIVVSNGAKQALSDVILATVNPGDEVVIPTPAWVSYVEMVKIARGVPVTVPTTIESDFKVTAAALEAAITPKTRMVMLNSPSNPTGSVYTYDELKALVDVLVRYPDIVVLSDEIYQHINFLGQFTSMGSFPEIHDRVVLINGVSKAYSMTGWRIGFSASNLPLAKALTKLQGQTTSNAGSISQKAAEAAYTGSQQCVADMCAAFRRRRDLIVDLMRQIPGLKVNCPQGAFYLFPEVSAYLGTVSPDGKEINTAGDLSMYLLEKAHVATVDGDSFSAPGYIRLSYATSDDKIREAVRRIAEALALLKKK